MCSVQLSVWFPKNFSEEPLLLSDHPLLRLRGHLLSEAPTTSLIRLLLQLI